jgi:hypothetical protein
MFCAKTKPSPEATTDFGVMWPLIRVTSDSPGGPTRTVGVGVVAWDVGIGVDGTAVVDVRGGVGALAGVDDPPHAAHTATAAVAIDNDSQVRCQPRDALSPTAQD